MIIIQYNKMKMTTGAFLFIRCPKIKSIRKVVTEFILKNESTNSRSEIAIQLLYSKCSASYKDENLPNTRKSILKEVFQNIGKIGKWPIAHRRTWNESDFDLNEMLSNMAKLYMLEFGFFDNYVVEYPINDTLKQVFVRPAKKGIDVSMEEMTMMVRGILELAGIEFSEKEISKDVQESFELDKEFREIPINFPVETVTLEELKEAVPGIDFERIIQSSIHPKNGNWETVKKRISSGKFDLFFGSQKNISSLIAKTKPRVLANYLILKYVEYAHVFYNIAASGGIGSADCLAIVKSFFPRASLRVFVRNHFKKENLVVASEMIENLKESFIEMIQKSTWLSKETKENAILKVVKMKKVVGYTQEYERKGALDEMFQTLEISEADSFFAIVMKINRFKTEQLLDFVSSESLLDPRHSLTEANAYYNAMNNLMSILVPFLDKPLFDFKYPRYVTMAGVGRIIAHEIGHAFDNNGRFHDETGHLRDWWSIEDSKEYEEKTKCFSDKIHDFFDPTYGKKLNLTKVLHEVLADSFGIEATWIAFNKMDLKNEESLIEFGDHDHRRLFFQIAALDFCSPSRIDPYSEKYDLELSHPTERFRVNVAFANSKSFSEAYTCPVGSKMNPKEKCRMF
ncbi:unnamed protein product [Caenorhabditis brenneri]